MNWKPYALYPGIEHAGVGGFILEAHSNGSWVVRHVIGADHEGADAELFRLDVLEVVGGGLALGTGLAVLAGSLVRAAPRSRHWSRP